MNRCDSGFLDRFTTVYCAGEFHQCNCLCPIGWPLGWRAIAGHRRYGDETGLALGCCDFFQLGAAIELGSGNTIPLITGIILTSSVNFGDQVSGWSIGSGADF